MFVGCVDSGMVVRARVVVTIILMVIVMIIILRAVMVTTGDKDTM